jgi:vancomycin resistance protein YoaR
VVPAVDGLGVDADGLALSLRTALTSGGSRRAELPMRPVEAARSTADAEAMGIAERIATFTTNYTSSNKPRNNNIHVLARDLDGLLIAPGDTFDLNAAAGPSTPEKGYVPAGAIVNGVVVPELGGGICQVATTMFNTVFFSGLPVVERYPHSLYMSNYPTGRDAAISIGGKNLRFTNDTEHWILIDTSYTDSSITISFFGTDPGYEVTYETGPWTNITRPPVKEIMDSTLALGSRVVQTAGQSGRTVVVVRTVTKDGEVLRTDTFKSVYRSTEEVVRVGTKPPVAEPSEPTTSS